MTTDSTLDLAPEEKIEKKKVIEKSETEQATAFAKVLDEVITP